MKYLLILLIFISSCSNNILNRSTNPEVEEANRKKRAVIGMVCIGTILILTVHFTNESKPK